MASEPKLEPLLGKYPVVIAVPVFWGDQDAFGHVNNNAYFRWFESARIALSQQIGLIELFKAQRIGPILVSIACDYPPSDYLSRHDPRRRPRHADRPHQPRPGTRDRERTPAGRRRRRDLDDRHFRLSRQQAPSHPSGDPPGHRGAVTVAPGRSYWSRGPSGRQE